MKRITFAFASLLIFSAPAAFAVQFQSLIDAMAIKTNAVHTNNGWEDTDKIKGIQWKWPRSQVSARDYTMQGATRVGKDKSPNIGPTTVKINGSRSMIATIEVSVQNAALGIEAFGPGKASAVKTTCDSDSPINLMKVYRFDKPGFKPLYLRHDASWGTRGGTTTWSIAGSLQGVLEGHNCKAENP